MDEENAFPEIDYRATAIKVRNVCRRLFQEKGITARDISEYIKEINLPENSWSEEKDPLKKVLSTEMLFVISCLSNVPIRDLVIMK